MTTRPLVIATAAGLVVVVAAAVFVARRGSTSSEDVGETATTSAAAPPSTTSSSGDVAAPSGPVWQTPKPGTYRYHHTRTGSQPADYDANLVVTTTVKNGFRETRLVGPATVSRVFLVDSHGVRESSFTLDSASGPAECRWSRPIVVVPVQPQESQEWQSVSECRMTVGGTSSAVRREASSKVVGLRSSTVDGQEIMLLRIDRKVVVRTTANGQTAERRSEFTDYFDPARGLLAQSTEAALEIGPSGESAYRIVETLLTTQPEVPKQ